MPNQNGTWVPDSLIFDPSLSVGARATYMVLLMHAQADPDAYPGAEKLADEIGCSERSLVKYFSELRAKGWLRTNRRGWGESFEYELLNPNAPWVAIRLLRTGDAPPRRLPRRKPIKASTQRLVFERDAYRCKRCGDYKNLHVDHIIPVSLGGTDDIDNLQTLCATCNYRKGNRM